MINTKDAHQTLSDTAGQLAEDGYVHPVMDPFTVQAGREPQSDDRRVAHVRHTFKQHSVDCCAYTKHTMRQYTT